MQIRTADSRRGDLDDGVARVDDLRIRNGIDPNVMTAVPCKCSHLNFLEVVTKLQGRDVFRHGALHREAAR